MMGRVARLAAFEKLSCHGNPFRFFHVRINMGIGNASVRRFVGDILRNSRFKKLRFVHLALAAVFVLVSVAAPAFAADLVVEGGGTLAQIVDGGGTNTIIPLVNLQAATISGAAPASYTLYFFDDNGNPLFLNTTAGNGSTLTGTLPAGGIAIIQTNGNGSSVIEGYAVLSTTQFSETSTGIVTSLGTQIAGSAVFSIPLPGAPTAQASGPLDTGENFIIVLPFDETGDATSAQTGVAIANSPFDAKYEPGGAAETALVNVTFFDQNGNAIPTPSGVVNTKILAPGAHTSFMLDQAFPQVIGQKGTAVFTALDATGRNYIVKILGLRATPSTFTSITPIIPCIPETYSNGTYYGCGNNGGLPE